jgi:dipeptidyl aminopeptidase/acylaminoacyl peptidase
MTAALAGLFMTQRSHLLLKDLTFMNHSRRENDFSSDSLRTGLIIIGLLLQPIQWIQAQIAFEKQLVPLPVEETLGQHDFLNQTPISLSRDGRWVAYTLQDNRRRDLRVSGGSSYSTSGVLLGLLSSDVWICDTNLGETRNLTNSVGTSWGPSWSPDGERLAFYSDRSVEQRVWLWERKTGTMRQLADVPARSLLSDPIQWTPDGTQVLVRLVPEGMTVKQANDLYVTPIQEDTTETTLPGISIYRSRATKTKQDQAKESKSRLQAFNNRALADIALIDINSGRVTRLTRGSHPIWFAMSPDGTNVAFTEMKGLESDRETQSIFDLVVVSLNSGTPRSLASNIRLESGRTVSWSPDSKMLAYITGGALAKGDCFTVTLDGSAARLLTPDSHPSFDNSGLCPPLWDRASQNLYLIGSGALWRANVAEAKAVSLTQIEQRRSVNIISPAGSGRVWSPDAGRSLVVMTRNNTTKQEGFYKIDLSTGNATKLHESSISFSLFPFFKIDVSANERWVAYSSQSASQSEDLWLLDSNDLSKPRQITHANPQLQKYIMGESKVIEWLSLDGQPLLGTLLLPASYKAGVRYPMVVIQYPGNMLSNVANRYPQYSVLNTQLLATRGYAVLLPDLPYRRGTTMSDIQKAVLPGINKVVEMGVADRDRIGVWGHSFGGYSVLSLIVQSTQFKAAVESAGISNVITLYGQMEANGNSIGIGLSEEQFTGSMLWEKREKFIENSPVFYLDRVQTPLLILQGTADDTTNPAHSDQVFVFLRSLGKEVEYVKYKDQVHAITLWSYPNQVDRLNRTIGWFERWLKSATAVPNPAEKPSARLDQQRAP